ncbi:hypothetical protein ACFL38_00290 [Candidatus Omnitrophota bacterium]
MKKTLIFALAMMLLAGPAYARVVKATFDDGYLEEPAMPNPSGFDRAGNKTVYSDFEPVMGNGVAKMKRQGDAVAPGEHEAEFNYSELYEGDELWMRGYFYLESNDYNGGTGTTYYVSSSEGSNGNNGLSADSPLRTYAPLAGATALQPGDTVLFKRGDTWIGEDANLWIEASGTADAWITFGAYGIGEAPLLRPAKSTTEFGSRFLGWNHHSGNIYYANMSPSIDWWPNCVMQDETTILFPKGTMGEMTAGTCYYNGSEQRLYVWASDGANPSTHTMHIATRWPSYRGTITTAYGAQYILIKDFKIMYSGNIAFCATDDYIWFKNCVSEYAYSAGFYWIHYTANPAYDGADYGRADYCVARYTCIGDSQAFTIEGSHTWLYDCLAEYNFMAGFDWLDYNDSTNAEYTGAVRCVAYKNGLRPGSYDPNFYIDGGRYIYIIDCISVDAGGDTDTYHPGIGIHNEHSWIVDVHHIYIVNTLSYGNKCVALDVGNYGSNANIDYVYVYGNTFAKGPDAFRTLCFSGMDNAQYGMDFRNNVVYGDYNEIIRWGPNYLGTKYHGDNNVFYRSSSIPHSGLFAIDRYGGGEVSTSLADWQAFTGQDMNSIEANPQFVGNAQVPFGNYFLANRSAGDGTDSPALNSADEAYALLNTQGRPGFHPGYGTTRKDTVNDDAGDFDAGFHYLNRDIMAMAVDTWDTSNETSAGKVGLAIDPNGYIALSNLPGDHTQTTGARLERDQWTCLEFYVKLHSQDGQAMLRLWKDGNLIIEDTSATLNDSGDATYASAIMAHLNDGCPLGEKLYLDEVEVYAGQVPPNSDASGNPMIGLAGEVGENLPPNEPYAPLPANGSIDKSITTDVVWNGGDPNGDPITYDVYFGTTASPALVAQGISDAYYNPGTLAYETIYYWQISASDGQADTVFGPVWNFTTEAEVVVPPENNPPAAPSSPSPANERAPVEIATDLGWYGSDPDGDELTYDVYFGATQPPILVAQGQSATSYNPGTLEYGTTYFWRIVASDGQADPVASPEWSFTTEEQVSGDNEPPSAAFGPWPSSGTSGRDRYTDVTWNASVDPDGDVVTYDVYFGTTNPPATVVREGISNTWHDTGELVYGVTYYWQISATDDKSAPVFSDVWNFTTQGDPNQPPVAAWGPWPSNGATQVSINTDATWHVAEDPEGDMVTYDVYFGTSSTPQLVRSGTDNTWYDPGVLIEGTVYYWQVSATDGNSAPVFGPLWNFTTEGTLNNPPVAAWGPWPSDGAVDNIIGTDVTWHAAEDPDGDAITYDIYFGTDAAPALVQQGVSHAWYDPGVLEYGTTYYWQVAANDGIADPVVSAVWSFTTEEDEVPVNNPPLPSFGPWPSDGTGDNSIDIDVTWNAAIDPDGDEVVYDVYFGTTPNPPLVLEGSIYTWYDPGILEYSTTYYWKVSATDGKSDPVFSELWSFSTEEDPNQPPAASFGPWPSDGTGDNSIDTDLTWNAAVDPDGDAVTYDVYFGTTTNPSLVLEDSPHTWYDPGILEYSTTYYWKVSATDGHSDPVFSDLWSFSTEQDPAQQNEPPTAAYGPWPSSGSTRRSRFTDVTWNAASDPEGDPITYAVYFGTSSQPPQVIEGTSNRWYDPGKLRRRTTYYWQIATSDGINEPVFGPVWNFRTR